MDASPRISEAQVAPNPAGVDHNRSPLGEAGTASRGTAPSGPGILGLTVIRGFHPRLLTVFPFRGTETSLKEVEGAYSIEI